MSRYELSRSRSISVPYSVDPERCTVPLFGTSSTRRWSTAGENGGVGGQHRGSGAGNMPSDGVWTAMTRSVSTSNILHYSQIYPSYYPSRIALNRCDAYRSSNEIPLLHSTWYNFGTTRDYEPMHYHPYAYRRYIPGYYGYTGYGYDYYPYYPYHRPYYSSYYAY